jgi:methyl-accepting chemotaxis protein
MLALMLAVAAMNGWSSYRVGAQVRQIVDVNNRRAALAQELLDNINLMAAQVRSIVLLTDVNDVKLEGEALRRALSGYARAEQDLAAALSEADDDERRLAGEIAALGRQGTALVRQVAEKGLSGANIDATTTLTESLRPTEAAWRAKVNELVSLQTQRNAALATEMGRQTHSATVTGALLAATATLLGIFVAWRIARGIQRPVQHAVRVAERIAQGALDNPIDESGRDEVGRLLSAMGAMQSRLRELVAEIRDAAMNIRTASAEVADGNTDLSQRTEQAAARLQQTTSSMKHLKDTLHQTAEAASQAHLVAGEAAGVARRGGAAVARVVASMEEINGSSKRIADITGVIDGIAFQTNILALNAAVEAARAGELGRGFAVVAAEVRSLAQHSAAAAQEIKHLIAASQVHVEAGAQSVGEAGETMAEVVKSAEHVSHIIGEITDASGAQTEQIAEVHHAIAELDHTTQQNAALVEQGAAAAESLKDQSLRLTDMVSKFSLGAAAQIEEADSAAAIVASAAGYIALFFVVEAYAAWNFMPA